MHLQDAQAALQADRWELAATEAQTVLSSADPSGSADDSMKAARDVLCAILRSFANSKAANPAHAGAAGRSALILAQLKHEEVSTLALAALDRINAQEEIDQLNSAVTSLAEALVQCASGSKDSKITASLRAYVQLAMARRQARGEGCAASVKALAAVSDPAWSGFTPFDPADIMKAFKEAWWSHGENMRNDPIDRTCESMPVIKALFERFGRRNWAGGGERGLEFGGWATVWVNGPQSTAVKGVIIGNKAAQGDSYILELKPRAGGGWLIAGIHDVIVGGQPFAAAVPQRPAAPPRSTTLPARLATTQPATLPAQEPAESASVPMREPESAKATLVASFNVVVPPEWKLRSKQEQLEKGATWETPGNFLVSFSKINDQPPSPRGRKKFAQERLAELSRNLGIKLYQISPRLEQDDRFECRVHARYLARDNAKVDLTRIYRSAGDVVLRVTVAGPAENSQELAATIRAAETLLLGAKTGS